MLHIYKNIFTSVRFYLLGILLVFMFILGYYLDIFFVLAKIGSLLFAFALFVDFYLLFTNNDILLLTRELPERFSNGDENKVEIFLKNNHFFKIVVELIDEVPSQFQKRDFTIYSKLHPGDEKRIVYHLRPLHRGEYTFGHTNAFLNTPVGILKRRLRFNANKTNVSVYPSFLNMRKFEFLAISNRLTEAGIKRIRKVGNHSEFDQIREYVKGDAYKSINWKATAKKNQLMVNQFQDERSQRVYNIIDKGRQMQMPFMGLSLLDYAINSSLVMANTAIQKHDKAGLITFNNNIDTWMQAERKNKTVGLIQEHLYKQETGFKESNFELLYTHIRKKITHRSLLILYTNFESFSSLERQLFYIQKLTKQHLVLVILFKNNELYTFLEEPAHTLEEIYIHTITEKLVNEKERMVKELNKHGIHAILTQPGDLTINLINKYLQFKDAGLL